MNADALACGIAALGFIALAALIVVIPQVLISRPTVQLSALLIACCAFAINTILQRTSLNHFTDDQPHSSSTMIMDLDRLQQLT